MLPAVEINFGHCTVQTVAQEPSYQYSLNPTQDTVICFTITSNGNPCDVRFTFHPFHRRCNLIYHEYSIVCFTTQGIREEAACRSSITGIAQQLYEKHFTEGNRYELALLETEYGPDHPLEAC
jgi:hypothetical protein